MTAQIDYTRELAAQFRLDDLIAFVPGGYGGIGEAICWGLALAGATPVIVGRNAEKAETLAGAIQTAGLRSDVALADAEDLASMRSAVDRTHGQHGRLDLLVNCIGIQREELLADVSEENFDEIYRVNVKAAMFVAQACARHQVAAGRGGAQVHLLSVRIPMGRVAEPKDVVGPVLFLCAPAASFTTGQVLYVDGGITASQ